MKSIIIKNNKPILKSNTNIKDSKIELTNELNSESNSDSDSDESNSASDNESDDSDSSLDNESNNESDESNSGSDDESNSGSDEDDKDNKHIVDPEEISKRINLLDVSKIQAIYNALSINESNSLSDQILTYIKKIDWNIQNDNKKLYNNICKDIASIPDPSTVLKLSISYEEKCELIEKIVLLNNISPMTVEFFDLKKIINNNIKNYTSFTTTNEELERYKNIEKSLSTFAIIDEKNKPLEHQILDLDINTYDKSLIYNRYKSLLASESINSQSGNKLKKWVECMINIPTQIKPMLTDYSSYEKNKYLYNVKKLLDIEIYGLEIAKERILFLLNNRLTNTNVRGLNFALSGPPGVAKTSLIQVLAKSVSLPFFQINSAGMKDSAFLFGHNFTYEGSMPGIIVQALHSMKYKNGIIYFDEFDKISTTDHGLEISRALLHITDASQNDKFHDHYVGEQFDIDLSNIWFIYSLNDKLLIEPTLRDRISIIEIEGYTDKEKKIIATKYLLPKAMNNIGIPVDTITFDDISLDYLIKITNSQNNTKSGVRQLKHLIEEILMKINFLRTIHDSQSDENKFNISFNIKNFKLPLIITKKIINDLNIAPISNNLCHLTMYS